MSIAYIRKVRCSNVQHSCYDVELPYTLVYKQIFSTYLVNGIWVVLSLKAEGGMFLVVDALLTGHVQVVARVELYAWRRRVALQHPA